MTSGAPSLAVSALPGYEAQPSECGVTHSRAKLENVELSCVTKRLPCEKEADTRNYRCTCTFQLVQTTKDKKLQYAMRSQQHPVLLGSEVFVIATRRIQTAMKGLVRALNDDDASSNDAIKNHLTSVSFVSSWNEIDCVITLHYDAPFDEEPWKLQAEEMRRQLDLLCIVGRSKGAVVSVGSDKQTLSDTVWLSRTSDGFSASLHEQDNAVPVLYEKPVTAFFHPNGRVMLQALEWLMTRLQSIVDDYGGPCDMLELYCGCGAHTVALASTGLLKMIVAVELDARLVEACAENCKRNHCYSVSAIGSRTPVHVVKGDAAEWSLKSQWDRMRLEDNGSSLFALDYQVLLVDPPRMGLDHTVCEMAMEGNFEHILYISCGRKALQRDLGILSRCFGVVDCTLLDLFPRTADSVESLVHLQRRSVR